METNTRRFTIEELCGLTDTPRRTVRYYIQQGLLDRPEGERRGAWYTQRHLEQLLTIRRWQGEGLSLERIRELLREGDAGELPAPRPRPGTVEVWSRLLVADGVELQVEPGRAGLDPEQVRALFRAVQAAYARLKEDDDGSLDG